MKKILLFFIMSALIFTGCDNNEVNVERDIVQKPTQDQYQEAVQMFKGNEYGVEKWQGDNLDLSNSRVNATAVEIDGYFMWADQFWITSSIMLNGCVGTNQYITTDFWLYDFGLKKWELFKPQSYGICFEDDFRNLQRHYNTKNDTYILIAADVYINNKSDGTSFRYGAFYSNILFLNHP